MRAAAILFALLTACGKPGAQIDTFTYAIVGDVSTLDPHWQYDGVSAFAGEQIYEGLLGYDGEHTDRFIPLLSTQVPSTANGLISKDGRTYTFPIRAGVKFHDGRELTPEDVRYSLLRAMLQDRDAGHAWMLLGPILGVASTRKDGDLNPAVYAKAAAAVKVEGQNVVVKLHQPFAPFLSILPTYGVIVSKSWVIEQGGWNGERDTWDDFNNPQKEESKLFAEANATGPFMVERWDRRGQQLLLARHEGYWRAPAQLKRIVIKTIPEFSTRRLLLKSGAADAIFLDRNYLPQVEGLAGVVVRDDLAFFETHNSFLFQFNIDTRGNPYTGSGELDGEGVPADFFADPLLRKAFALAFPAQKYIDEVYRGKGRLARGPIPYGVFGYDDDAPRYDYDPGQAAALLSKAHGGLVAEHGFKVACIYQRGKETRGQACNILKDSLRAIDPRYVIEVHGLQWSTYLDLHRKKKLPLVNARWGLDYPDPHNPVYAFLHSEGTYGKTQGYENPAMDKLIEEAARSTHPQERQRLYRQIQTLAYEDVPQVYTLDTVNFRVQRAGVKNWDYNPVLMSGYLYPVSKE